MRSFAGRDILSLKEFERNEFFHVFDVAVRMEAIARARKNVDLLKEKTPAPKVIDKMHLELNFDFDKSNIRPDDMAKLQGAVDFVKKYPGSKVRLEGYTDSIGAEEYNQALSERRAETVKSYLVKEGACDQANVSAVGYGETKPVASNKTEEGRAKNRRVEVLIMSE